MTMNRKRQTRTALIAGAVVLGMTGMAFAAVPLYKAFCRVTGYGGTTQEAQAAPDRTHSHRRQGRGSMYRRDTGELSVRATLRS